MSDQRTDDRHLVQRLLEGDEAAFSGFIDDFYPRLYRFAFPRVGRDPEVARDVVQGTFEKLIPRLGSYRGEAGLFTWVCGFCRFEVAAYWRRQGRRAPEVALFEETPHVRAALESLAHPQEPVDETLHRKQLARLVWTTLDHLPVRYGNALEWKYIKGQSVREIAARLDVSPKAAESILTRARQAFRDGFAEMIGGQTS